MAEYPFALQLTECKCVISPFTSACWLLLKFEKLIGVQSLYYCLMRFLFYLLWKQYKCWLLLFVCSSEMEPTQRSALAEGAEAKRAEGHRHLQSPRAPHGYGELWPHGARSDLISEMKKNMYIDSPFLTSFYWRDVYCLILTYLTVSLCFLLEFKGNSHGCWIWAQNVIFLHMAWLPLAYFDQTSKWFLQI